MMLPPPIRLAMRDWLDSMILAASVCVEPAFSIMCAISRPSRSFLAVFTVADMRGPLRGLKQRGGGLRIGRSLPSRQRVSPYATQMDGRRWLDYQASVYQTAYH